MREQIYDKSYLASTALAANPKAYLCVVQGADDYHVTLPAAANAAHFIGITLNGGVPRVSVRKLGECLAWSNGAIAAGNHVGIASANGDVLDIETAIDAAPGTAKVWQAIGVALTSASGSGQLITVCIDPSVISVAAS